MRLTIFEATIYALAFSGRRPRRGDQPERLDEERDRTKRELDRTREGRQLGW